MLFFPVFATLQPRIVFLSCRSGLAALSRFVLSSIPIIQPLCFQTLADSFAQWALATPLLSISSGLFPSPWGCIPPSLYFSRLTLDTISSISRRPSFFSSITYKMSIPQLLCFDNDPFSWGVYTPCLDPPPSLAAHKRTNCAPLPLLAAGSMLKVKQP
jgi:hypothetical protein